MTRLARKAALVSVVGGAAGLAWLNLRLRRRPSVPPPVEPGRHSVRVIDSRRVVPSPGLPSEVACGASNNNLDVVRHGDGFIYLAFRSAPHHFANPHTTIYVVRSHDEVHWEFEARFAIGTDLREPRLLSLGETLFLDGANDQERIVYDYSCGLDGPDLAWLQGQRGETFIYRHTLRFARR